jgi:hypothetical protein
MKPFSRFRQMDTSGRALNKRHTHPLLKPPNGLADGRTSHTQAFARSPEAACFRDRDEDSDTGKVWSHW